MGSPMLPPVPAPALGPSVLPAEPGAPGVAAQPPPSGGGDGDNSGVTSGGTRGTAWLSPGLRSARGGGQWWRAAARRPAPQPAPPLRPARSLQEMHLLAMEVGLLRRRPVVEAGAAAAAFPEQAPPTPAEMPSKTHGEGSLGPIRPLCSPPAEQPVTGEQPFCLLWPPGPPVSHRQAESWTMGTATSKK